MPKLSRILLAGSVAGSLALTLTACGGSDDKDAAAQARTTACRSYLVGGGAGDEALAATLVKIVRGFSSNDGGIDYEPQVLKGALLDVRTGAAEAGRTKDLSDSDFKVFAQLAAAVTQVQRQLEPAASDEGLDESSPGPLTDAVEAVHKLCR